MEAIRNLPRIAIIITSPATVQIDPSKAEGRGTTPGVIIRASVYQDGYKPSIPSSRTYIFLEKVKTQVLAGRRVAVK